MHNPLTFQLIIKGCFSSKLLPRCRAYPQINLSISSSMATAVITLSLTLLTSTTCSHSSSSAIAPTPPTPSPFPDHHSLYRLPFIPSILAPCPLHLTSCIQHSSFILFLGSSSLSSSLSTHTTYIPHPSPHPKAPIRPPVILLVMFVCSKVREWHLLI